MTDPANRKRVARRSSAGAGQWMLGAVIVLAVAGTGMWVFSDDKRWGLVSLILLIWGLVIAAFLVARNQRDLRSVESKEGGLKAVYALQLEREIAARREYELQLEHDLRAELRDESNEELTALKAEVLALRANLEELLGRDLGPSYTELYAAAEQRALAAQQAKSVFEDDDRFRAQQDFAGVPPQVPDVDSYYGAASAVSEVPGFPAAEQPPVDVPPVDVPPVDVPPAAPQRTDDDAPTAVFQAVVTPEPAADAEPVDVEHVEHIDPDTDEPFVPLAPQSGYRPPFPPRRFTPDAAQQQAPPQFAQYAPPERAPQQPSPAEHVQQIPTVPPFPTSAPAPSSAAHARPQEEQAPRPTEAEGAAVQPEGDGADPTRGQHSSGSTVAELIARMNADTERTGGRRRKPE
ncbi:DUF6779 domain-containing protein [Tsukamurella strandjordii]|uniref:DUF6779 domain-containing protein n=1 Tax=Tsukamurella strandjordii TaxID=147577 RepID=UPI0031D32A2D